MAQNESKKDPFTEFEVKDDPFAEFATDSSAIQSKEPNYSELESAGMGAVQGASLGFADEIEGAVVGAGERLFGDETDLVDSYRKYREKARAQYEEAQNDHPNYYMAGEVGAGVAVSAVPILNVAKGATLAKTALTGLAGGAASGLGSSNADLTEGEIGKAASDTAIGGGAGLVLGSAAHGLTKTLPEVAEGLKNQFKAGKRVTEEGRTILGEKAGERIAKEVKEASKLVTETGEKLQQKFGKDIETSRKALTAVEEGKYTGWLDSQLKKIDDFIASKPGETLEKDFPELAKMRAKLDRLRSGSEVTKEVPFEEIKKIPGKPSTVKKLEAEAAKLTEQSSLSGENAAYSVIETTGDDGKKYASLVKRTKDVSNSAPEKMVNSLDSNGEKILDDFGNPMQDLEQTGIPSVSEGLKVKTLLSEPEVLPLDQIKTGVNTVTERLKPNLTPSGEDIASSVQDIRGLTENVLNKETLASAKDVAAGIRSDSRAFLEGLSPDIAEANQQYKKLMDLDRTFGSVTKTGDKGLVGAVKEGDALRDETQIRNFIENMSKENQAGRRSGELVEEQLNPKVVEYVQNLRKLADDKLAKGAAEDAAMLAKSADDLETFLGKSKIASEDSAARQSMQSTGLMGIPSLIAKYSAYGAGKSPTARLGLKATEKVLEASPQIVPGVLNPEKAKEIKEESKTPVKTSQNIYNMSNDDLIAKTETLRQVRPEVADRLKTAIENKDEQKKKAMQFVIAQDPKLRELFNA